MVKRLRNVGVDDVAAMHPSLCDSFEEAMRFEVYGEARHRIGVFVEVERHPNHGVVLGESFVVVVEMRCCLSVGWANYCGHAFLVAMHRCRLLFGFCVEVMLNLFVVSEEIQFFD